ncbi:MAG: hypothetical protein NVSMB5_24780 [Candidatus Velthaea sp.]
MQQTSTCLNNLQVMRLQPLALAVAFGIAGIVEILFFGTVMGSMWGMMGGTSGSTWMMGGHGYGGVSMGGGLGYFVSALIWGFFGGAIAGSVAAWVYNAVNLRSAAAQRPVS